MSAKYVVSLNGVQAGKSVKEVAVKLSPIFKRTVEQVERMLSSGIYEIKKGLDEKTAEKYKAAIQTAGGLIEIAEEFEFTIDDLEQNKNKTPAITTNISNSGAGSKQTNEAADTNPPQIPQSEPYSNRVSIVETEGISVKRTAILAISAATAIIVLSVFFKNKIAPKTEIRTLEQASTSHSDINSTKTPITCSTIDTCFQAMLTAMSAGNVNELRIVAEKVDKFAKPARGNRNLARKLNDEGLKAFRENDFTQASTIFAQAQQEDPSDAEVAANLGFARVRINDINGATKALMAALILDPRRTSTWVPIAELLAKSNQKSDAAVSALMIAYEWSTARQKAIDFYTTQANTQANPNLQRAYQEAIRKIALSSSFRSVDEAKQTVEPNRSTPLSAEQYLIQVGAYSTETAANAVIKRIERTGFRSFTENIRTESGELIRVRSGPFATREAADQARNTLRENGFDAVYVTQLELQSNGNPVIKVTDSQSGVSQASSNWNFLLGKCLISDTFDSCTKEELLAKTGGAYSVYNAYEKTAHVYVPDLVSRNNPPRIQRSINVKVEYSRGENPNEVITKSWGIDADKDCVFYSKIKKVNGKVLEYTMPATGICSDMAIEGSNYSARRGPREVKLLDVISR